MPVNFVAKAVSTAVLMGANMALSMTRKIEGPRLNDTKFTSGDYGVPLNMVWGMRRVQGQIFFAEDLREVKQESKSKGGKQTTYKYYGTWAVAVAGHEIDAIRRIWFDTHLVFDLSGEGPVTLFDFGQGSARRTHATNNGKGNSYLGVYLGTEDQEPDPRMQATVEADFGEGSCPAYRGTAYIIFKDIPLEKLGNRIPQCAVEVVRNPSALYPSETVTSPSALLAFSPDKTTLLASGSAREYAIFDVAARQIMAQSSASGSTQTESDGHAFLSDGTILVAEGGNPNQPVVAVDFSGNESAYSSAGSKGTITSVVDADGLEYWLTDSVSASIWLNGAETESEDVFGFTVYPFMLFLDADGEAWWVGYGNTLAGTKQAVFYKVKTGDYLVTDDLPDLGSVEPVAFHYADETNDHFVLAWGGVLYAVPRDGSPVSTSYMPQYPGGMTVSAFRAIPAGAGTFFVGFEEISSDTLTQVRQLDYADWAGGASTFSIQTVYDPVNHALIAQRASYLQWCYLDRIGSDGVTLGAIAVDIADRVGVVDYDFSDLDQTVQGWSATQGQASNMLEPLFDAYDSDIRPHDFTLQGAKRAGTSGGTLTTERFVAADPRYTVKVRQGAELPRAVVLNFADVNAEQQPNNARAARPLDATGAKGEQSIDLTTLALDPDEARALTDRYFRRIWNERKEASLSLTAQQIALEPGDVRTLELDDEAMTARLVRLTVQANGSLATDWKYDHPSLALLDGAAGASFDGRDEAVVVVPLLSKGFVLDIPLISDADAQTPPVAYVAAAPYAEGAWPGATVYQAVDGEYSEEVASVSSSNPAAWGYATDVLADANPNLWDRGNSVNVRLQTGTLTGTTEAAIDANPLANMALIGDEIVNFTTATLEGDGSYTLSGFKRGRRGTEWAGAEHVAGEVFVMLSTAQDVTLGLSEVGTNLSFKAITTGRTTAFPVNLQPFTGASLKPYAPTHLEAVKESNGDWTLSWVRRTRVGGAWTSGTSIPLSEASEEYELDLSDGVDTATKTVTGATTYTWTQAAQVADVGAEVMAGGLDWSVVQISDEVDRGFVANATA